MSDIDTVYQENRALEDQIHRLKLENHSMSDRIERLTAEVKRLKLRSRELGGPEVQDSQPVTSVTDPEPPPFPNPVLADAGAVAEIARMQAENGQLSIRIGELEHEIERLKGKKDV